MRHSARRPLILQGLIVLVVLGPIAALPQSSSSASHHSQNTGKTVHPDSSLEAGTVGNGVYRNKSLRFTCKIPAGWVLRTEEMNADESTGPGGDDQNSQVSQQRRDLGHPTSAIPPAGPHKDTADRRGGKVLLATFSRPPEARGEEVNAAIIIAAEAEATYPGLKEAGQYFGPLTEVARAQGFTMDEDPYEIAIGKKALVRGDFHKDVGTRVMRQSTLVMLMRGYAVSFTVIAGTKDEVEDLIDGLDFAAGKAPAR